MSVVTSLSSWTGVLIRVVLHQHFFEEQIAQSGFYDRFLVDDVESLFNCHRNHLTGFHYCSSCLLC